MAAIDRRVPDRVPLDYWGVPEMSAKLMETYDLPDLATLRRFLKTDMVWVPPPYRESCLRPPEGEYRFDPWGNRRRFMQHGHQGGYWERVDAQLEDAKTLAEVRKRVLPRLDAFDWDQFSRDLDAHEGLAIGIGYVGLFQSYWYLRGYEQSLTDLKAMREMAHYLINEITDWMCELDDKTVEVADGRAHIYVGEDDWGMQTGPLVSPMTFHEFYKEPTRRWLDNARRHGLRIFYHSDGSVADLLDDFVDLGIEILNPVQTTCAGMDPLWLKGEYGDKFCFHGAIDTQRVLPQGTVEDVKRETLLRLAQFAPGGGYIGISCHAIQADTPVENVMAMYETLGEYGSYPLNLADELERRGIDVADAGARVSA